MIPVFIDNLDSVATSNRIINTENIVEDLQEQVANQQNIIRELSKQNYILHQELSIVNENIARLQRVDHTLITLGVDRERRIIDLNKELKILKGLQISQLKATINGFNQINNNHSVSEIEIKKLERALKNLKIN